MKGYDPPPRHRGEQRTKYPSRLIADYALWNYLNALERHVLASCYGLDGADPATIDEVCSTLEIPQLQAMSALAAAHDKIRFICFNRPPAYIVNNFLRYTKERWSN